uniref:ADP-ribosylation factor-like protein 6-interacting protein 4 n=1 Tax=Crocodylus porosus TaxID=8502 RepID=A0A7M4FLP9_CROPO
MAHSQSRKRSRSRSDSRSRQERKKEKKGRKSSKDSCRSSPSPTRKRASGSHRRRSSSASTKEGKSRWAQWLPLSAGFSPGSEQPWGRCTMRAEQKSRIQAMKPMTKEEWDARQSVIRKVVDPETGRTRLIKGDGEVLEEIVTKERHKEINKQATRGDGLVFQMRTGMLQ